MEHGRARYLIGGVLRLAQEVRRDEPAGAKRKPEHVSESAQISAYPNHMPDNAATKELPAK